MITSHHSFSTRIFLNEVPGAHATAAQPAAGQPDNLNEFWWFLRSGRGAALATQSPDRTRSGGSPTLQEKKKHA